MDFHEFHMKIHDAQNEYLKDRMIKSDVDSMKGFDTHEFNVIGIDVGDHIKTEPMDWVIPEFDETSPTLDSPINDESDANQSDWNEKLEKETIAAVIADYFEPTCELCPMELNSLERAIEHYQMDHQINGGFLKCCEQKIRTDKCMEKHIRMHLEANDEPQLIPMKKTKKASKSIQLKKANKITKKLLPKNQKKTTLLGKKHLSKTKESGRFKEENLVKVNVRKRCYVCQSDYKRDRKVQTTCESCQKHTCNEHAVHTHKCHDCVDVPLTSFPTPGASLAPDNVRKRCVFCPSKISRKVRQVCLCCRRYTCNEHAIVSHKCHGCAIAD